MSYAASVFPIQEHRLLGPAIPGTQALASKRGWHGVWDPVQPRAATASTEPLGDVPEPKWVIAQAKFRIEHLYYEKTVARTKGIYTLTEVATHPATLEEHDVGRWDTTTAKVQIEDLLRQWQECGRPSSSVNRSTWRPPLRILGWRGTSAWSSVRWPAMHARLKRRSSISHI